MLLPSIFPFSSGLIAFLRMFIHSGLLILFFLNYSFISLPLALGCALLILGIYPKMLTPLLLLMYLLSKLYHHEPPSIWVIYCVGIFLLYPKGYLFSIEDSKPSASWINALSHRLYSLLMIVVGLSHILGCYYNLRVFDFLNFEDPWSDAFPFLWNIPIAIVELICGFLALKKGVSFKLWIFSSVLSVCALIFEPTEVSASFVLFHSLLFRLSFFPSIGKGGLIIYDGDCSICHGFIRFLLKEDIKRDLYFISNQDEKLSRWREAFKDLPFEKSVIFVQKGEEPLIRGEAAIELLLYLGGFWSFLGHTINLFPLSFINFFYRLVAQARHLLASKPKGLCPIVPKEWQGQFKIPKETL